MSAAAVKRIMSEAREIASHPAAEYTAGPIEDNCFEWHFTVAGPPETDYASGLYHGKILLPSNYPFAPPSLMLLTPNGRFEPLVKVCLSFTQFHEECAC